MQAANMILHHRTPQIVQLRHPNRVMMRAYIFNDSVLINWRFPGFPRFAMPPPLSDETKQRIQQHIFDDLDDAAIAAAENVSDRVVRKIRLNIRTFGTHTTPSLVKKGRPRAITAPMQAGLRAYLEAKPWAYQDEMIEYIFDNWGVLVDQSTLSRTLKRIGISRKRLKRVALERNDTCRHHYMLQVSQYTADMLVFLDESAANEHTKDRKYGWSGFGTNPSVKRPIKRSKRWSILPAYTQDGLSACHVYQGAIKAVRYEWWLENEVLPRCNAFPGRNSVLIMDNASIHHSQVSKSLLFSAILTAYRT